MIKIVLKLSKAAYVMGLLSMGKFWVKGCALNLNLTYLQAASWQLDLTNS